MGNLHCSNAMEIVSEAKRLQKEIVKLRREIHRNPELSYKEKETAKLVSGVLADLGIPHRKNVGGHGVVAAINVKGAKKTIAFRADMDALPVTEETGLPFASRKKGIMHACGHDSHVAMLLGTAILLKKFQGGLKVNVRLIFQPAEELPPGGAAAMMKDGLAEEGIDEMWGLHVHPRIASGRICTRSGPFFAAPDAFSIKIIGRGGHAAAPHNTVDPVPIAAEVVGALQTISSRRANPLDPMVLSVCTIHGGTVFNVIPDCVEMSGTVRTFSRQLQNGVPRMMKKVVESVAKAHGARCELEYKSGYLPLVNDERSVRLAENAAVELFGRAGFDADIEPVMFGEDFSYYLQTIRGAFLFLGAGGLKPREAPMYHTSRFNPDETVFWRGPALFTGIALKA